MRVQGTKSWEWQKFLQIVLDGADRFQTGVSRQRKMVSVPGTPFVILNKIKQTGEQRMK